MSGKGDCCATERARTSREVALVKLCESLGCWEHVASQRVSTALMKAAMRGHSDTVELLLDRGANPEAKAAVSLARAAAAQLSACGCHGRAVDLNGDRGGGASFWVPLAGSRAIALVACCEGTVVAEGTWPRRVVQRR